MNRNMWVYLNGSFVSHEEARISVFDHGFLYGDGIYETLRAYAGRPFMLKHHVARLYRSGAMIGLRIPLPEEDWPGLIVEALTRNGLRSEKPQQDRELGDAYLRITISRGTGDIGLDPDLCPSPTVLIMAKPLIPYPRHLFEEGVRVSIVSVRRNLSTALPPQIKSLNFLNNILAKREATKGGFFDGLMLNAEGALAECTASNVFFVREGRLYTPSLACGILDGITRGIVLQLSREAGLIAEEGAYSGDALLRAEECFLTNTSMEIMPVTHVNDSTIGSGHPGPITITLRERFHANLSRFLT